MGGRETLLFNSRVAFWRLSTLGWVEMNACVPPLGLLRSLSLSEPLALPPLQGCCCWIIKAGPDAFSMEAAAALCSHGFVCYGL